MKKAIRILLALVGLAVGVYIVDGLINSKPPQPTITSEGKKVEVIQGTYCWFGLFSGSCVDMISPPEIIKHHSIKPVVLSPGAELKIKFKKDPKENTLGANMWLSNNKSTNVSINDGVLVVPKEKGVYVYNIYANWEKGSSSYAIVIEVQ